MHQSVIKIATKLIEFVAILIEIATNSISIATRLIEIAAISISLAVKPIRRGAKTIRFAPGRVRVEAVSGGAAEEFGREALVAFRAALVPLGEPLHREGGAGGEGAEREAGQPRVELRVVVGVVREEVSEPRERLVDRARELFGRRLVRPLARGAGRLFGDAA